LVGAITLGATLLLVIIAYSIAASSYPNTIPLQAGDFHMSRRSTNRQKQFALCRRRAACSCQSCGRFLS
jgi:hypothetical protein